jgi:uncharacterized membrane protein
LQDSFLKTEAELLDDLRDIRRKVRSVMDMPSKQDILTFGQRVADSVAATVGSWPFIIVQSIVLTFWIALNITAYIRHWDPYPFILLNLVLSFQAAYAAPIIMMSQNRQADIDRQAAATDHQVNLKAELEVEALHQKIDQLREFEIVYLSKTVHDLVELIKGSGLYDPAHAAPLKTDEHG